MPLFQNPLLGMSSGAGLGGTMSPSNALLPPDPNQVTPAQGWAANAQAADAFLAQQRAKSSAMGLMDPRTGLPTRAGLLGAAGQYGNALMMGTTEPGAPPVNGLLAYHGSPHSFDRFDMSKIGTGEGAQAYGHGLYFAGNEGVAKSYRDQLSPYVQYHTPSGSKDISSLPDSPYRDALYYLKDNESDWGAAKAQIEQHANEFHDPSEPGYYPSVLQGLEQAKNDGVTRAGHGTMYQVQINANPDHLLDWDKSLSDQHSVVQDALAQHLEPYRQQLVSDALPSWRDPTPEELAQTHAQANDAIGALRGGQAYDKIAGDNPAGASQALQASGVPGLRYLDQGSRGPDGSGDPSHNIVVFNDANIDILKKYGLAGIGLGGAATAGNQAVTPADSTDQGAAVQRPPIQ